jgi:hypothetical protein
LLNAPVSALFNGFAVLAEWLQAPWRLAVRATAIGHPVAGVDRDTKLGLTGSHGAGCCWWQGCAKAMSSVLLGPLKERSPEFTMKSGDAVAISSTKRASWL